MGFFRPASLPEVNGKRPQRLARARKDRRRPAGGDSLRQRGGAVLFPQRIGGDVSGEDRLRPVHRGPAASGVLTLVVIGVVLSQAAAVVCMARAVRPREL